MQLWLDLKGYTQSFKTPTNLIKNISVCAWIKQGIVEMPFYKSIRPGQVDSQFIWKSHAGRRSFSIFHNMKQCFIAAN